MEINVQELFAIIGQQKVHIDVLQKQIAEMRQVKSDKQAEIKTKSKEQINRNATT